MSVSMRYWLTVLAGAGVVVLAALKDKWSSLVGLPPWLAAAGGVIIPLVLNWLKDHKTFYYVPPNGNGSSPPAPSGTVR